MVHACTPSRWTAAIAACAIALGSVVSAEAKTFRASADQRDVVQFTSEAPLENIVGQATNVQAEVKIADLSDIVDGDVHAMFKVELATMDTGIALRNQHMRDMYLETDEYPYATFTLTDVKSAHVLDDSAGRQSRQRVTGLTAGQETHVTATGTFELHGVKRDVTIEDLALTYIPATDATKTVRPGDLLGVAGSFGLKLGDYDIERPQFVLLRLSGNVDVDLKLVLGSGVETSGATSMACGGCGGDACGGCGGEACGGACGGCGGNPCGGDACGGNPCGGDACGGNPCGGDACGGNPCGS